MVTIYDIAKETGFTAPTVSKALNGRGVLSEKTRNKIVEKAKEMGYSPNITARTLTTKKSNLIGVVYDDTGMNKGFSHPLFSIILNRFRDLVEAAGYDLVFLSRHFNMTYYKHAQYRSVDAIIIINPASPNKSEYDEIAKSNIPCVSTNTFFKGICTVLSDNEKSAYVATENFIKHGHKKIAFLSAPADISSAPSERLAGYKKALADYGIPYDENLVISSDQWSTQGGYEAMKKMEERGVEFSAIFAVNDWLADGVYKYCHEKGLRIPQDLSVIGFDDTEAAQYMTPTLSTFRQDAEKIAEISAALLFDQISGKEVPELVRCETVFMDRESVCDKA